MPFSCGRRISCHDVLRKFANQVAIEVRPFHHRRVFRRCGSGEWYCRSWDFQIERVDFLDTHVPHDEQRTVKVKAVPWIPGVCH